MTIITGDRLVRPRAPRPGTDHPPSDRHPGRADPPQVPDTSEAPSLHQRILGEAWHRLPRPLRRFHALSGLHGLEGEVVATAPERLGGRLLARVLGLPCRDLHGTLRFSVDADGQRERWTRRFPHGRVVSTLRLEPSSPGPRLAEMIGPVRLVFALAADGDGLTLGLERCTLIGLPWPRRLRPRIRAREWAETGPDGDRVGFDVRVDVPGLGTLAHDRGHLVLPGSLRP